VKLAADLVQGFIGLFLAARRLHLAGMNLSYDNLTQVERPAPHA
jgi:hypothetical protein